MIIETINKESIIAFLIFRAQLVFAKLRQAFSIALILHHFDLKRHIRIERNASDYIIVEIFNQLILDNLGQWYPVVFFPQKMIHVEI